MKKIIYLLFPSLLFSFSNNLKLDFENSLSQEYLENTKLYKAIYIADEKNNVYYKYNENKVLPLASLTKLMTAILIMEDIKLGKYNLDTIIVVSKEASKVPYGYVIKENSKYKILDLLKLLLTNSSNSSAHLLAEYSSSNNLSKFITRMNNKAKELNLNSLRFYTPHGLPPVDTKLKMDIGNSRDMYLLAKEVLKYNELLDITKEYTNVLSDGTKLTSTNTLLKTNSEIKGLKTGYHRKAMYNIVYYIENDEEKIIEVILGSNTTKLREKTAIDTIDILKKKGN